MTRSLAELLVGRVLCDRYAIEELIGQGGMSLVYRGTDRRLGRPVAIKVVSLPGGGDEHRSDLRERFRREAASAARIPPHPNVVQVFDYGTDGALDLDFLVMELLRGQDLKATLRTAPPPPAASLRILLEAARGLAAGHRAGIVHRDVKPANIFLSGAERLETVKILDFGIAKALEGDPDEELTRTGQIPHSPAYAAPEQLEPGGTVGPAADVFQLGLVAYELLAGERPFSDPQRARLRAGEPVALPERGRWPEVAPALRGVIAHALRPRPEQRYPDATALAEALAAATDGAVPAVTGTAPSAAAPPGADDEATLFAPLPAPPPAPPPLPPPTTSARAWARGMPRARVWIAGATALALLGVWALGGMGDDAPETATPLDVSALGEEFRPLALRASRNLREEQSIRAGPVAATEVERVLLDLHFAWVQGELDRHLAHYADRVDFYGDRNARRQRVRREREETLERFPEREITIERTAINFPDPGRARVLVDKSWSFGSDEERWEGAARQEWVLELEEGRWRVVSERDLEVHREELWER